ncbi:purple acid phosphatase 2 [Cannabis sativa]|uniref:purple acid phosphatase 2 n=1 Tax=Cannabis sativa TaxID=3483 RepID=UPI0011DFCE7B|nr:purple acid phosphatase 2 [Cannabis sativa]XP_030506826.1 purple acid phosphatase 2 [Cannabis sativa]XP_060960058.1 purple acid phosphatase 2 [Cannabis sativa]XP_060960059.1 purple acid phosphatase 2 [Cannabis sativa]
MHYLKRDHVGEGVIVSWITPNEPGSSTLLYWSEKSHLNYSAQGIFITYSYFNYTSGYLHHCTIDDLEFDTNFYQVGIGNTTRKFWFITFPGLGPDVPYTFGIIGDIGRSHDSNRTLTHYELNPAKGQIVLFVGDIMYSTVN